LRIRKIKQKGVKIGEEIPGTLLVPLTGGEQGVPGEEE